MGFRLRASGLHFLISVAVAVVFGLLVFLLWYPPPFATLAGGLILFAMLVGIDVVLGPFLTALVANPKKPRLELRRDIGLIVVVQLLAFGYGAYSIALARPVHLVFEVDRLTVVSAADIDADQLIKASPAYQKLPWTGPTLIAARKSESGSEMTRSLDLGLQGVDISMQPERWVDYNANAAAVLTKARSIKILLDKYPALTDELKNVASSHELTVENIRFLPMTSRRESGVALIAASDARFLGYLPVDGFF